MEEDIAAGKDLTTWTSQDRTEKVINEFQSASFELFKELYQSTIEETMFWAKMYILQQDNSFELEQGG